MKKWTKKEEDIVLKLLKDGNSYLEISDKLNRTKRSIKEKVNKLGYNSKSFSIKKQKCLNCDNEIDISTLNKNERKFCSNSCSASFNNKLRIKKVKEIKKCLCCDKEIKINWHNNIFCNKKCHNDYVYREYIKNWKNDKENGKRGEYGVSNYIRRYLFEKYNNSCTKCNWSEVNLFTNKIPLEVEHIDGNSNNNKEENLTLLCPNCHSLTKTYKGGNKGNGRHNRMKRYYEGKSY